jgi:hypothetical protein
MVLYAGQEAAMASYRGYQETIMKRIIKDKN